MKLLVIGSKGFIGSHCVRILSEEYEIWECDIVNDYVSPRYLQVDVTSTDFKEIFQQHRFDACLNCAGAASVPDSFLHPLKDMTLNAFLVMRLLEAIRLYGATCKFINMSSAAVYGNPSQLPVVEAMSLDPLSPYGLHKKMAEEIVHEYASFFGVLSCSLRPFSVYGPGLRKQLFWDVHSKVQKSEHIELWGTGDESRDFIYVDDMVKAIRSVLLKAPFKGESINVASGRETTIREAIETFQKAYFKPFHFSFGGQKREGDPLNWKADIAFLSSFGFEPITSLQQGLTHFSKWLQKEEK